ncbi:MAG: XAC2610-related protein [Fluviicola sp.]
MAIFNFDSLSDFCILNNVPGSGTPSYNFFLQKSDSLFVFNKTFTNEIRFAPQKLNPKSRTFDINSHSGCCFLDFKTFKILENGRIKLIRHKTKENGKVSVLI